MYQIHTTPGFIIEARPKGEAGKILTICTRDLGLVRVAAEGIRLQKSKLRYYAQEYTFGVFSLVRGKEYWRLTSAAAYADFSALIPGTAAFELVAREALLLRRLLHGEEPNLQLFEHLESCYRYLSRVDASTTREHLNALESLSVLRILHALGYIGQDRELDKYMQSAELSPELTRQAETDRHLLVRHINKALRESQL